MSAFKSAVRAVSLKSLNGNGQSIQGAENHAKRLDPTSQKRSIHPENKPIAWSKAGDGKELNYVEAFKAHKKEFSAGERKNSALAMEFKIVVSPEWLQEIGDPLDPNNPRVKALFENAKEWAESWGGQGSVWGLRYDTDEAGSGVVDVFMSPIREQKHKNGKTKQVVSCRKAREALLEQEKALDASLKTSGGAMQSSWARWCQERLDPRIERGERKEITGKDHLHADVFKEIAEKAKNEGKFKAEQEINTALNDLIVFETRLNAQKVAQEKKQKELEEAEKLRSTAENEAKRIILLKIANQIQLKKINDQKQDLERDFKAAKQRVNDRINNMKDRNINYIKFKNFMGIVSDINPLESFFNFCVWFCKLRDNKIKYSDAVDNYNIHKTVDFQPLIDFNNKNPQDFYEFCIEGYTAFSKIADKIKTFIEDNADIVQTTRQKIDLTKSLVLSIELVLEDTFRIAREKIVSSFQDNKYLAYFQSRLVFLEENQKKLKNEQEILNNDDEEDDDLGWNNGPSM